MRLPLLGACIAAHAAAGAAGSPRAASPADLQRAATAAQAATLYEQIGGAGGAERVVAEWHRRLMGDVRVSPFFVGTDMAALSVHRAAFLAQELGGPQAYTGRSMAAAHARLVGRLGLSPLHFDIVVAHLQAALSQLGTAQRAADGVVSVANGVKSQVLQQRQTGKHEPELVISGIGAVCPVQAGYDGAYYRMGTTASGRAWYLQDDTTAVRSLYFDPDCDASQQQGGGAQGRWVLDAQPPSLEAAADLDSDGRCEYVADAAPAASGAAAGMSHEARDAPPGGLWNVFCGGECVDSDPAGCAASLGSPLCTSDQELRGRCCATCARTAAGEVPGPVRRAVGCADAAARAPSGIAVATAGGPLRLTCGDSGSVLFIQSATYGREDCAVCPSNSSCRNSTCDTAAGRCSCAAAGTLSLVRDRCAGRPSCELSTQAGGTFGDPCPGEPPYLSIAYECRAPAPPPPPSDAAARQWTVVPVTVSGFRFTLPCVPQVGRGTSQRRRMLSGTAAPVQAVEGAMAGRTFYSFTSCAERVVAEAPGANGATLELDSGLCYAEYGMNTSDGSTGARSCRWADSVGGPQGCVGDDYTSLQELLIARGQAQLLGGDCGSTRARVAALDGAAEPCRFEVGQGTLLGDVCCELCSGLGPGDGGGGGGHDAGYCALAHGACADATGNRYDTWTVSRNATEAECGQLASRWQSMDLRSRGAIHLSATAECLLAVDDGVVPTDHLGGQLSAAPSQAWWHGHGPVASVAPTTAAGARCLVPRLDGVCQVCGAVPCRQEDAWEAPGVPHECREAAAADPFCRTGKGEQVCATEVVPLQEGPRCRERQLAGAAASELCRNRCGTCAQFGRCMECIAAAEVASLSDCGTVAECAHRYRRGFFLSFCSDLGAGLCRGGGNLSAAAIAATCEDVYDALAPQPSPGACPAGPLVHVGSGQRCGVVEGGGAHKVCATEAVPFRLAGAGLQCDLGPGEEGRLCRPALQPEGGGCYSDRGCLSGYCQRAALPRENTTMAGGGLYGGMLAPAAWGSCRARHSVPDGGRCLRRTDCARGSFCAAAERAGPEDLPGGVCRGPRTALDGARCQHGEECGGGVCDREAWPQLAVLEEVTAAARRGVLASAAYVPGSEHTAARINAVLEQALDSVAAAQLLSAGRPRGVCRTPGAPGAACLRDLDCADPNEGRDGAPVAWGCRPAGDSGSMVCAVHSAGPGEQCDESTGVFCAPPIPGVPPPSCRGGRCVYAQRGQPCTRSGSPSAPPCDPATLKCSRTNAVGTCGSLRREGDACDTGADCAYAVRNCTPTGGCAAPEVGGACGADADCPAGSRCGLTAELTAEGRHGAPQQRGVRLRGECTAAVSATPAPGTAWRPPWCGYLQSKQLGQRCSTLAGFVGVDNCDVSRGLVCIPTAPDGSSVTDWPAGPAGGAAAGGGSPQSLLTELQGRCVALHQDLGNLTHPRRFPASIGPHACRPGAAEFVLDAEPVREEGRRPGAQRSAWAGWRAERRGRAAEAGPRSGTCRPYRNKRCSGASACGELPSAAAVLGCSCDAGSEGRCVPVVPDQCAEAAGRLFAAARRVRFEAAAARTRAAVSSVCGVGAADWALQAAADGVEPRHDLDWRLGNGPGETWAQAAEAAPDLAVELLCCVRGHGSRSSSSALRDQWANGTEEFATFYDCSDAARRATRVTSSIIVTADLARFGPAEQLALRNAARGDIARALRLPQQAVAVPVLSAHSPAPLESPSPAPPPAARSTAAPTAAPTAPGSERANASGPAPAARAGRALAAVGAARLAVSFEVRTIASEAQALADRVRAARESGAIEPWDMARAAGGSAEGRLGVDREATLLAPIRVRAADGVGPGPAIDSAAAAPRGAAACAAAAAAAAALAAG
eukprot:TRINITY_DN5733_c2_g2_i2.p1 TRINITY_DN5733_c2_g2~~TRINITY_DN5733_c2_g2_i2.p1  ORF type:complete len:1913 (+),score=427.41 TRINITY_DN5733_c2_g2_i2:99-5741(+)